MLNQESIIEQTSGLNRDIVDKFYTKDVVVKFCLKEIQCHLNINKKTDHIIEPSAGNGAFINGIKTLCNNYNFYDLMPENNEILKQDFMTLDYSIFTRPTHIIGNPPFGRQSSIAIKFIRYCAKFCQSISFILPKSFKKESMKNKIPLDFHCIYEVDLPKNSFMLNNIEHNVPCVFQIWIKKNEERMIADKLIPKNFSFVKKEEDHHISFRRVGVNAGAINTDTTDKSIQSHYFIKFDEKIYNEDLLSKLRDLTFKSSEDTVGPKSISKQELIKEFIVVL